jgi:hypothetical protein
LLIIKPAEKPSQKGGKIMRWFGSKTKVAPADKWLSLVNELSAKLEWARSIDINEVAQKAGSTPEAVMKVAHPDLWLELGIIVQATEKCALEEAIALGEKILVKVGSKSEIWTWYSAYMNSPTGWGVIKPHDYMYRYLGQNGLAVLNHLINIGENVRRNLHSLTTIREYLAARRCIPDSYLMEKKYYRGDLAWQLNQRKESLLNEGRAACKTLGDLINFYYSIPTCPHEWVCICDARNKVAWEIYEMKWESLENATSVAKAEAIEVPQKLDLSGQPNTLTNRLAEKKKDVLEKLQAKAKREEERRIRSLL